MSNLSHAPRPEPQKWLDPFSWRSYDLNHLLPPGWQTQILRLAAKARPKWITTNAASLREGNPNLQIEVRITDGNVVKKHLPWLYDLYKGVFHQLAQLSVGEPIYTAQNDQYGAVLQLQRGTTMRFDVHVDTNPLEGLLYVTDQPKGAGGELAVSNNPQANSLADVDADCSVIYPVAGHLLFLDGRRFPHYVRPLKRQNDVRVVVAMNFYTPSCPETARPQDLDTLLFGP